MKRKPITPPSVSRVPTWILTEIVTNSRGQTKRVPVSGDFYDAESAYQRAARETIDEAARQQGCTYMTCQFGEWSTTGRGVDRIEEDTRCKYCHSEKSDRIVARLARWLQWRDSLAVKP